MCGSWGLWAGYLLYKEINVSDPCVYVRDESGGGAGVPADRDGV